MHIVPKTKGIQPRKTANGISNIFTPIKGIFIYSHSLEGRLTNSVIIDAIIEVKNL